MFNKMRVIAERLEGGLLFFIISAFMFGYLLKKLKINKSFSMRIVQALVVIIFVIFGTDNNFAKKIRYRKNAGYEYLKMTEYFKSMKEPSDGTGGFTILTNYKTAVDVYAFFNAYVFQYKKDFYGPLALSIGRKDLDRLLYCPQEDESKLIDFIEKNRVDYIIVPTLKTEYVGKDNVVNFDRLS
jgi:hypothetical protein